VRFFEKLLSKGKWVRKREEGWGKGEPLASPGVAWRLGVGWLRGEVPGVREEEGGFLAWPGIRVEGCGDNITQRMGRGMKEEEEKMTRCQK
jgi:hypothetical protein